jgi:hypothetical protein
MDSKMLTEIMTKIVEFLETEVQEGIPVIKFKDETMESDGVKVNGNLIIQEIDGDLMLERVVEVPATRFDPADVFYEELAITTTIEEMLPILKDALEEDQEEKDMLSWMDYENDIESEEEEDEDDL